MQKDKNVLTNCHFGRLPKSKTVKMYFTRAAKIKIQQALGFGELYLLEYWLEKVSNPLGYLIDDKKTAVALGITVRSVKKYRIALQQANLFRVIKTTNSSTKCYTYCLGKEGVYTATYFPDLFGYGINSIAGAMKGYGIEGVTNILDESPITPQERKDIYELFDAKYKGQFRYDEMAA